MSNKIETIHERTPQKFLDKLNVSSLTKAERDALIFNSDLLLIQGIAQDLEGKPFAFLSIVTPEFHKFLLRFLSFTSICPEVNHEVSGNPIPYYQANMLEAVKKAKRVSFADRMRMHDYMGEIMKEVIIDFVSEVADLYHEEFQWNPDDTQYENLREAIKKNNDEILRRYMVYLQANKPKQPEKKEDECPELVEAFKK